MDDNSLRWLGLLATVRALHIAVCMALAALWLFDRTIATARPAPWRRWIMRWTWLFLPIIATSGATWFALACMQITDMPIAQALAPAMMAKVLTHTEFGSVCMIRAAGWIICLALAILSAVHPTKLSDALLTLFAAGLLLSLAWVGHGQVGQRPMLHLTVDAIHLVLGAVWPVGLWPMLIYLRRAPLDAATIRTLKRFSAVSLLVVIALAISGTLNSLFMLQMPSDLIDSPYGIILSIKIGLFLAIFCLGALQRLKWLPAIAAGDPAKAIRRIRQTIVAEAVLAIGILIAVGWLGTIAPPFMPGMQ